MYLFLKSINNRSASLHLSHVYLQLTTGGNNLKMFVQIVQPFPAAVQQCSSAAVQQCSALMSSYLDALSAGWSW